MEEIDFELENLRFGTAKKKADLLKKTKISPVKLASAVKKFGEPMPSMLADVETYTVDFFDFLLESDPEYYGQFVEEDLESDLAAYVNGEVWSVKHNNRSIVDKRCAVGMDIRKMLKDANSAFAQTIGHLIKHSPKEALEMIESGELRVKLIEVVEGVVDEKIERPLRQLGLLGPAGPNLVESSPVEKVPELETIN